MQFSQKMVFGRPKQNHAILVHSKVSKRKISQNIFFISSKHEEKSARKRKFFEKNALITKENAPPKRILTKNMQNQFKI
jgi:hypothetical protein